MKARDINTRAPFIALYRAKGYVSTTFKRFAHIISVTHVRAVAVIASTKRPGLAIHV